MMCQTRQTQLYLAWILSSKIKVTSSRLIVKKVHTHNTCKPILIGIKRGPGTIVLLAEHVWIRGLVVCFLDHCSYCVLWHGTEPQLVPEDIVIGV